MRRSVILTAGNSCFVACPGCYNHFARTLVDTPTILRFTERLHVDLEVAKVTVGGGDPLTRPDIVELVSGLRSIGLRLHLDTVGTAFIRDARIRFMGRGTTSHIDVARIAGNVEQIGIPLDGSTDEVIRSFRHFGSLADQIACMSLLDSLGAAVCVNTVVHQGNIHDLEAIAGHIARYPSVRRWQLFQFMPSGPLGSRNRVRFAVSQDDYVNAVAEVGSWLPDVTVSIKSNSSRKNSYLLVDGSGIVWTPRQGDALQWKGEDENPERIIHGHIGEVGIVDRLRRLEALLAI